MSHVAVNIGIGNINIPDITSIKIKSTSSVSEMGSLSSLNKVNHGWWNNFTIDLSGMNNFSGEQKFDIFWIYIGYEDDGWYDSKLSESCAYCIWKKTITMNANEVKRIILNSRLASIQGQSAISSVPHNPENLPFGLFHTTLDNVKELNNYIKIKIHNTFLPENQTSLWQSSTGDRFIKLKERLPNSQIKDWHSVNHSSAGQIFGDFPPTNLQIPSNIRGNTSINITWENDSNVDSDGRANYISLLLFKNNIFIRYITKCVLVSKLSYTWNVPNNLIGKFKIKMEGGHVFGHAGSSNNLPTGITDSVQGTLIDSAGNIYTRNVTDTSTQIPLKETQEFNITMDTTSKISKIPSKNRLKGFTTKTNTPPISFRIENKFKNVPRKKLLKGYTP
tara:strand:+ start:42 stop:1214 length:1173 start_codon:yes stop_codon:yes gene_type:complete